MTANVKYTQDIITRHNTWKKKSVLRKIYENYYKCMSEHTKLGKTLEIGGGSGEFKALHQDVIISDIQLTSWIDVAADAQSLPFVDSTFSNIMLCDVLHHIECPPIFFDEAERILKPGGRLIMLEPAITPISHSILHLTHPEPINMNGNPFFRGTPDPKKQPFDANQAIPTLIFKRKQGLKRFATEHPQLHIMHLKLLSLFAYPLSGGFRNWSLIPKPLIKPLLSIEEAILPILGPLMAFRLLIVIEKR